MPTELPKPTAAEVKAILFDSLMSEIEPDLMIENRTRTAANVAALPPEKQAQKLQYFGECFERFLARWPSYLEEQTKHLQKFAAAAGKQRDTEELENIEGRIDDASPFAP